MGLQVDSTWAVTCRSIVYRQLIGRGQQRRRHGGSERLVGFKILAVLTLMTNRTLVGRMTGASAGFSPLRLRPVQMMVVLIASFPRTRRR